MADRAAFGAASCRLRNAEYATVAADRERENGPEICIPRLHRLSNTAKLRDEPATAFKSGVIATALQETNCHKSFRSFRPHLFGSTHFLGTPCRDTGGETPPESRYIGRRLPYAGYTFFGHGESDRKRGPSAGLIVPFCWAIRRNGPCNCETTDFRGKGCRVSSVAPLHAARTKFMNGPERQFSPTMLDPIAAGLRRQRTGMQRRHLPSPICYLPAFQ